MFSSLSGDRSQQADSAVRRFRNLSQVKQGERGDQIFYFPKPILLTWHLLNQWLINKVEYVVTVVL